MQVGIKRQHSVLGRDLSDLEILRDEFGVTFKKAFYNSRVFLGEKSTRGIHQSAAKLYVFANVFQNVPLNFR